MTLSRIILASASPRRSELLNQIGMQFLVIPQHIDESRHAQEEAKTYVIRMADEKAAAALQQLDPGDDAIVIAADTAVVCGDEVLGKPVDREDARNMITLLSNATHQVLSAITVATKSQRRSALSVSAVTFREISDAEIEAYWQTGEPADKAGSYAIQGLASVFVKSMTGSYSSVMGLPLFETAQLLNDFGVSWWQPHSE